MASQHYKKLAKSRIKRVVFGRKGERKLKQEQARNGRGEPLAYGGKAYS